VIALRDLSKHYGRTTAVDRLSTDVLPGKVTAFLGPNGAGKSTTMRMVLGLDHPSAGTATVSGHPYPSLPRPLREVGALLDARATHPGRSARRHLLGLARSNRLPASRVEEVLDVVGLSGVADARTRTYSLGMHQRLGVAAALLGDPPVLLLDEPVNGLDPDGVRWIRHLLKALAREGRTVLVSSHLISEMQDTADHVLVIGRGHLLADASLEELLATSPRTAVAVRTPAADQLEDALARQGQATSRPSREELLLPGASLQHVAHVAAALDLPLHELASRPASLEDVYVDLTTSSLEHVPAPLDGPTRQPQYPHTEEPS